MSHHEDHDERTVTDDGGVFDEEVALAQADAETVGAEGADGPVFSRAVEDPADGT